MDRDYKVKNKLDFVEPDEFQSVVDSIIDAANFRPGYPAMRIPWLWGNFIMGRARIAHEASIASMKALEKLYPGKWAYARLDLRYWDGEMHPENTYLARELANQLSRGDAYSRTAYVRLPLSEVLRRLKTDLNASGIIVQIDNYQCNPELAHYWISHLVKFNLQPDNEVKCIPVVSGVPAPTTINFRLDRMLFWQFRDIYLRPVKGISLVARSRWQLQNRIEALDLLLDVCGDSPHIVARLVRIIEIWDDGIYLECIKQGTFDREKARRVWIRLVDMFKQYLDRWIWVIAQYDLSICTSKTEVIIGRILKVAISGIRVNEDDLIVPEVDSALTFRKAAVFYHLVGNHSSGFVVDIPFILAHILNNEYKVFPTSLWQDPFEDKVSEFRDSYTIALAVRATTAQPKMDIVKLQDLRPGARTHVGNEELRSLEIRVSERMQFVELKNDDFADRVGRSLKVGYEREREWNGIAIHGTFFICATGQAGIDGVAILEGSTCTLEILSLYTSDKSNTESVSPNPHFNDSYLVLAVRNMQAREEKIAKFMGLDQKRRIVVYDVCTSHLVGPINQDYSTLLKPNEVLLFSDKSNMTGVLGPTLKPHEGINVKRMRLSTTCV